MKIMDAITRNREAAAKLETGMQVRCATIDGVDWIGTVTEIDTDGPLPIIDVALTSGATGTYTTNRAEHLEILEPGAPENPARTATVPTTIAGAPTETTMNIFFEHEPCTRCSGSGRFCGGVCFLCNGARTRLSRRGRTAKDAYIRLMRERMSAPVETITEGARVHCPASGFQGFDVVSFPAAYRTVTRVQPQTCKTVDGTDTTVYVLWFGENKKHTVSSGDVVRISRPELRPVHHEIMRAIGSGRYKGAWIKES